ncbi:hypothetical protein P20652_3544 [Pseudoalteromonas sp. BSi20652]|nr:hypothetical protein P20652_3544 [Pseudoalteromonas sp. BSi20652]
MITLQTLTQFPLYTKSTMQYSPFYIASSYFSVFFRILTAPLLTHMSG